MNKSDMDTLRLPARIESLKLFQDFTCQKLKGWGLPQALEPKVELILEEILANVFNYAYAAGTEGEAEVGCELKDGSLRFVIADWGAAFNPLESPPPDLTDDIDARKVGGLGIFFVKEMVDAIAYDRAHDQNILTIAIRVNSPNT